jgi:hypothetical protein
MNPKATKDARGGVLEKQIRLESLNSLVPQTPQQKLISKKKKKKKGRRKKNKSK